MRGANRQLITTIRRTGLIIGLSLFSLSSSADTTVYGTLHGFLSNVEEDTGITLNSYSSRLGIRGANLLANGWRLSHQLELELNTFHGLKEGDGIRKLSPTVDSGDPDNAELDLRNAWLGMKNEYGEFRVGRHLSLSDISDNGQDLLSRSGHALVTSGRLDPANQILYVNRNGHFGYAFSWAPFENESDDRVVSVLTNYAFIQNGTSYYAGLNVEKAPGIEAGAKISLGMNRKQYALGLVLDKQTGSDAKSATLTGRYQIGKAYLGAEYGSLLDGDVASQDGTLRFKDGTRNRVLEVGYQLNRAVRSYVDYAHLGNRKEFSLAVRYDF